MLLLPPSLSCCRRASPAADRADVLDRIRRHLCAHGGPLAASPGIGVITRVGSRWNHRLRRSWRLTSRGAAPLRRAQYRYPVAER